MFGGKKPTTTLPVADPNAQMWQDCYDYLTEVEPARFTPDLHRLSNHYIQLLFVMDQLTVNDRGLLNEDVALKLGYGFTRDKYSFWKKKLGHETFGIPLENTSFFAVPKARIKGSLYAVSVTQFWEKLDFYYQNGVLYERKRIKIVIPYVKELRRPDSIPEIEKRSCFLSAWAYIGVRDYWYHQLDAGYRFSPVHCFGNKKIVNSGVSGLHEMPYYRFTSLELKD
jgi:hypothetical protein